MGYTNDWALSRDVYTLFSNTGQVGVFLKNEKVCENLCLPGLKSNGLVISGVKMRKIRMIKVEYGRVYVLYNLDFMCCFYFIFPLARN